jgi:hypothetical protein
MAHSNAFLFSIHKNGTLFPNCSLTSVELEKSVGRIAKDTLYGVNFGGKIIKSFIYLHL